MTTSTESLRAGPTPPSPAPLGITLRRYWRWWMGELAAMIPAALGPAARLLNETTFIQVNGGRVQARRYRDGRAQVLGELDLARLPGAEQPVALKSWLAQAVPRLGETVLVISPVHALCRTVALPLAADDNLRQVLAYELDRYTPFTADDVYFDHRVLSRGLGQEDLQVQFAVAPQRLIDPVLNLLAQAGVRPSAVVIEADLGPERLPLNLLPPERRLGGSAMLGTLNTLLAALAVVLVAASLALPIWQKRQAIAALTPQVERAKRAAEGASELEAQLDQGVREYNFLLQRKHTSPAASVVLEELTRILADGTWLQQLDLRSHQHGWEVLILGETTTSSKLINLIEASPLFREAGFKSPLVKGQAPSSERFQLGAALEPAPSPKPLRLSEKRAPPYPSPVGHPATEGALRPDEGPSRP